MQIESGRIQRGASPRRVHEIVPLILMSKASAFPSAFTVDGELRLVDNAQRRS